MGIFEILAPEFDALILPNAPLVMLTEGCAWLKGPLWFANHNCRLLVSDLPTTAY